MKRWIWNTVFAVLIPLTGVTLIAAVMLTTLSTTLRPEFLTRSITDQRVYRALTETFPALLRAVNVSDPRTTSELSEKLREQLTPSVYRATVRQFFMDAEAWIRGRSMFPPHLNLAPLVQSADPETRALFSFLPPVLAVPMTPAVDTLRATIRGIRFLAPATMIVVVLELLGVFATGRTLSARIRRVAVVLLLPSIPGVFLAVFLAALPIVFFGSTQFTGLTAALLAPSGVIVTTLVTEIVARMMYAFIALLPLSALLFLFAGFVKRLERARAPRRSTGQAVETSS